jgi:hypothetical protein
MWVYVALDAPVKFTVLKVRNESRRSRRLSATGYVEWVLGDLRPIRYRETVYEIDVLQRFTGKSETSVTADGVPQPDGAISLVDDRRKPSVEVVIRTDRGPQ